MTASIPLIDAACLRPGFWLDKRSNGNRGGHMRPPAKITDQSLTRNIDTFVNRAAWIDGFGIDLNPFTVFLEKWAT